MLKKTITGIILLLIIIVNINPGGSQELPKIGDIYKIFKADLNNDGKMEKILLKVCYVDKENYGWYGQLMAMNSSGDIIWSGKKGKEIKDTGNPETFGSWDMGSSLPQIVGDIDGDKSIEILACETVSDVRYTPFKMLRWDGKKFYCVFKRKSYVENASGIYELTGKEGYKGKWISEFLTSNNDGTYNVYITDFSTDAGKHGKAMVSPVLKGFKLIKWIEPLKNY